MKSLTILLLFFLVACNFSDPVKKTAPEPTVNAQIGTDSYPNKSIAPTFYLKDYNFSQVSVAGDFNGWTEGVTPLIYNNETGFWELSINLPKGEFRYKYVADGNWILDQTATKFVNEGDGGRNSVIVLESDFIASPTSDSLFSLTDNDFMSVHVVGDFNGWNQTAHSLMLDTENNTWKLDLSLPIGSFAYKFLIEKSDGEQVWVADFNASKFVTELLDGAINVNSVIELEDSLVDYSSYYPYGIVPTFFIKDSAFENVSVAGEFNGWDSSVNPLNFNDQFSFWELNLDVAEGIYQYKLVADGNWIVDYQAKSFAYNDGGQISNSVYVSTSSDNLGYHAVGATPTFYLYDPEKSKESVNVAGEFSGWSQVPLNYDELTGYWKLNVTIAPGTYQYKLVVDNNWVADFNSKAFHENGNSLLMVFGN